MITMVLVHALGLVSYSPTGNTAAPWLNDSTVIVYRASERSKKAKNPYAHESLIYGRLPVITPKGRF